MGLCNQRSSFGPLQSLRHPQAPRREDSQEDASDPKSEGNQIGEDESERMQADGVRSCRYLSLPSRRDQELANTGTLIPQSRAFGDRVAHRLPSL